MKLLTIHASLNAYPPNSKARSIFRYDALQGYNGPSWHYVIERDGTLTRGRSLDLPSVRDSIDIASNATSVLLMGGWSGDGPVNDFTKSQRNSLKQLCLGRDRTRIVCISPVPSTQEVIQWTHD